MKKIWLISVLAVLVSLPTSSAYSLDDAIAELTPENDSARFGLSTAWNAMMAASLNVESFKELITEQGFANMMSFNVGLIDRKEVGIVIDHGDIKAMERLYSDQSTSYFDLEPPLYTISFQDNLNQIIGVGLTFGYSDLRASKIVLTLAYRDGSYSDYIGEISALIYDGLFITGAMIDKDKVHAAYVLEHAGAWDDEALKSLTRQVASLPVPEPATATLSLIALAGLMTHRRRALRA